jgi:tRNA-specific 2-thiouridylase
MQMYDNLTNADSSYGGCCTIDDLADARRVAWKLEIPHFTLNLEKNFHEKVIAPFVQSYLHGMTPSPCVLCNTHVKFDLFHQKAQAIGAEKIATGHYARITTAAGGKLELRKAKDLAKDQSYFLFELRQEQLERASFPLGEMSKREVRAIARRLALSEDTVKHHLTTVFDKTGVASRLELALFAMQHGLGDDAVALTRS